ncbi:uncharacterized protein [Chironomus tepperi]|uniref:uncharacterized protein n=1 Tax=Chironomus tepperi TaxID=113505 RepID=UPI00391F1072
MRILWTICILSCLIPLKILSSPIKIECNFLKTTSYHSIEHAYECQVMNTLNITLANSTTVDDVKGKHHVDKSNDDVVAFRAINKTTLYFPRGLHRFFENLQAIYLEHGRLKEIHQADFSRHKDLKALYLGNNDIEVLEDGLFEYNVNLEFISFWGSNIFHIDEGAFRNLNKLTHLWLNYNKCSTKWVSNDADEVGLLIKELGMTCNDVEFSHISDSLKKLERSLKTLSHENYQEFSEKFKTFGKNFQNSNFSNFLTFKDRFEGISNDPNYRESNDYLKLKNTIEIVKFNHKGSKAKCENVCYADVNKFAEDIIGTLQSTFKSFSALSQKVSNFGHKITNSNLKITNNLKVVEDLQNEVENIKLNLKLIENSTNLRTFEVISQNVNDDSVDTTQVPIHTPSPIQIESPTSKTQEDRHIRSQSLESKVIKSQSESNLSQTRKPKQKGQQKPCELKACPTEEDNAFKIEIRKNIEDLKNDTKTFEDEMVEKVNNLTKIVNDLTEQNKQLTKTNEELAQKITVETNKLSEDRNNLNTFYTGKLGSIEIELALLKLKFNDLSQKNQP